MCPLFNSYRDSGLLKGINRELLNGFISTEIALYKLDVETTDINIYEESEKRMYYNPIRLYAQVRVDGTDSFDSELGIDFGKSAAFGLLKDDLRVAGVRLEEGDIIFYDDRYYEVDKVSNSNYWSGRNPNTMIGTVEDDWPVHGYDHAVIAECHMTKANSLHIVDKRQGENRSPIDDNPGISKFI